MIQLANTIDIKNQEDSAKLNTHLYNLTQDTVDDSATIKVITVVTLLYLPASFIGVSLNHRSIFSCQS
jgi:hypothetical protein